MVLQRGKIVSVGERVRQGSMQPIYVEVAFPDGVRLSAIAKFPTRENRAPIESVVNESLGCMAARIAGVQAPPCFIVEASPHVILHLVEKHAITPTAPFGFASQVCAIDSIIYPTSLESIDPEDLARLFFLDMLLINADRTPNNPNCGQSKRRLFAFDFGSALISPKTSTDSFDRFYFGPGLNDRASAHLCRSHIDSSSVTERAFGDVVESLCKNRWYANLSLKGLPPAMQDHLKLAVQFFDFVGQERRMLCRQIVSTV